MTKQYKTRYPGLRVRKQPTTAAQIVGMLREGATIDVEHNVTVGANIWHALGVSAGGAPLLASDDMGAAGLVYAAHIHSGTQFTDEVGAVTPPPASTGFRTGVNAKTNFHLTRQAFQDGCRYAMIIDDFSLAGDLSRDYPGSTVMARRWFEQGRNVTTVQQALDARGTERVPSFHVRWRTASILHTARARRTSPPGSRTVLAAHATTSDRLPRRSILRPELLSRDVAASAELKPGQRDRVLLASVRTGLEVLHAVNQDGEQGLVGRGQVAVRLQLEPAGGDFPGQRDQGRRRRGRHRGRVRAHVHHRARRPVDPHARAQRRRGGCRQPAARPPARFAARVLTPWPPPPPSPASRPGT